MISTAHPVIHSTHSYPSNNNHGFHRRQLIRDSRRRTAAMLEKRRRESDQIHDLTQIGQELLAKSRSPAHKKKPQLFEIPNHRFGIRNSIRKRREDHPRLKEILMEVDEFPLRNLNYSPYNKIVRVNSVDTNTQLVRVILLNIG
ncbi:hypothetical protein WR25_04908 [Diploscapter pachys]|uniref:Uncharacterized protein n=1 Tax=Diploscapter pachys TaxID=2018661 RepID=A0A2A2JIJ8_9BILA|nr:hypothetical protein WR25_04908 [Diploscapter pachys]